ncbi:MAG: hypothetical protein FWD23_11235, partial [Oscillospiraceae bacterium]|nr:hypothetical protein [Oscillospiraceae bacterium]
DAWFLWDDNYLYVFAQMDVVSTFRPDEFAEWQAEQPWMLTTFEVIIDFANAGGGHEAVSMVRSDDSGFLTMHAASQAQLAAGDACKQYVESGHVSGNNFFTVELKIDIAEFRKAAEAEGLNFGSDFAAGKQIGIYLFAQECHDDGTQALFVSVPTDMSGNWVPDNYDYMVLGSNEVNAPAAEESAAAGGGEEADAEIAPVIEAARPASSPRTNDAGIIILIVLLIASTVGIVIFKRHYA